MAIVAAFLLALTLLVLGPVLFGNGDRVLSSEDADLAMQFVHWRGFGFAEMRAGHLPLWNPHIFGGAPFLGGFQSALLYPPNWLYLVLPPARAINLGITLHVFLAGFFMYLWTRERRIQPLAGAFAAVLFMFCGPHFSHIDAGHLPNLCAMVWGPLIILAIDRWLARRTVGSILLGGGATALQILAGHPQYVFYTGIAAGLYSALGLIQAPRRWLAALGLALVPVIAAVLSAAQLLEGLHAAGASLRSRGVTCEFAATFSFPPENLLTLLAPGFFGTLLGSAYWGRDSLWEMSLFFGVTGLVFAVFGTIWGRGSDRWRLAGLAGVLLLLASSAHTPLFPWLYGHVPGFDKFRGLSKFTYPAILFLIVLAAQGFDALLVSSLGRMALITGTAGAAFLLAACTWWQLSAAGVSALTAWMQSLYNSGEVFLAGDLIRDPSFQASAARQAAHSLALAAATLAALSLVLLAARRRPGALAGVLVIACAEMLTFAGSTVETFSFAGALTSPATDYLNAHPAPPGSRILNLENPNLAMSIGARDLWGYDPGVTLRYAEWMADSQGMDPDDLNEHLAFTRQPSLYGSLLGCRTIFPRESTLPASGGGLPAFTFDNVAPEPRLALATEVHVLAGREAILAALRAPSFDPRREVILESPPQLLPTAGNAPAGTAALLSETSDRLIIDAHLTQPAVLVVADAFCSGWTVRSLLPNGAGGQARYVILPADYCLRGVPLAAGQHRFEMVYRPPAFILGAWISAIGVMLYLLGLAAIWRGRQRRRFDG